MAKELVDTDFFLLEVSQNENTKDDKVYFYLEHFNGGDIELYMSVEDYRDMIKCMTRLDNQLTLPA